MWLHTSTEPTDNGGSNWLCRSCATGVNTRQMPQDLWGDCEEPQYRTCGRNNDLIAQLQYFMDVGSSIGRTYCVKEAFDNRAFIRWKKVLEESQRSNPLVASIINEQMATPGSKPPYLLGKKVFLSDFYTQCLRESSKVLREKFRPDGKVTIKDKYCPDDHSESTKSSKGPTSQVSIADRRRHPRSQSRRLYQLPRVRVRSPSPESVLKASSFTSSSTRSLSCSSARQPTLTESLPPPVYRYLPAGAPAERPSSQLTKIVTKAAKLRVKPSPKIPLVLTGKPFVSHRAPPRPMNMPRQTPAGATRRMITIVIPQLQGPYTPHPRLALRVSHRMTARELLARLREKLASAVFNKKPSCATAGAPMAGISTVGGDPSSAVNKLHSRLNLLLQCRWAFEAVAPETRETTPISNLNAIVKQFPSDELVLVARDELASEVPTLVSATPNANQLRRRYGRAMTQASEESEDEEGFKSRSTISGVEEQQPCATCGSGSADSCGDAHGVGAGPDTGLISGDGVVTYLVSLHQQLNSAGAGACTAFAANQARKQRRRRKREPGERVTPQPE